MRDVFADTFYFLALLNPADTCHEMAKQAARDAQRQRRVLVTTIWVLTELGDALAASRRRGAFLTTLDTLRFDPRVIIMPPSLDLFDAGIALYRKRPDKEWSATDCMSFVVMKECGITEALTGDHHFEQAGFKTLLK